MEILKRQCEDHSNTMAKKAVELLTYKTKEFMKSYPLGIGAKEYVKEEFQSITQHTRNV